MLEIIQPHGEAGIQTQAACPSACTLNDFAVPWLLDVMRTCPVLDTVQFYALVCASV